MYIGIKCDTALCFTNWHVKQRQTGHRLVQQYCYKRQRQEQCCCCRRVALWCSCCRRVALWCSCCRRFDVAFVFLFPACFCYLRVAVAGVCCCCRRVAVGVLPFDVPVAGVLMSRTWSLDGCPFACLRRLRLGFRGGRAVWQCVSRGTRALKFWVLCAATSPLQALFSSQFFFVFGYCSISFLFDKYCPITE